MDLTKVDFLPYAIAWGVLGVIVLILAMMRRKIADKEDDTIKLSDGETAEVAKQEQLAKKLSTIELWGKTLTIILVVSGVVLGLLYGWQMWEASSTAGLH